MMPPAAVAAIDRIDTVTRWKCPCGAEYDHFRKAKECAAREEDQLLAVGDIVWVAPHYGWHDGDPDWIVDESIPGSRGKHHSATLFAFYFVVVAIDRMSGDWHRWRYHLRTRAMISQGYAGWTAATHFPFKKADLALVPQKVIAEAADMAKIPPSREAMEWLL